MSFILRFAHGIMAGLFAFSVTLQFNDPNPAPWILLYGISAVAAGLAAAGRPSRYLAFGVLAICAIWEIQYLRVGAWHTPFSALVAEWHMTNETIVLGREFYALILIGIWMTVIGCTARRNAPPAQ
ncbi:MAG: hypothetical protein NTX39_00235 [Opitutae bacterium]|nr:hypothetical protein [Opitutae bacterium]